MTNDIPPSTPVFAVVGPTNKGKSSIVASLAATDAVVIGKNPGTTTRCSYFPFTVDGEVLFTLVDTPGFERPRRALEWMQERETNVSDRPQILRDFVSAHQDTEEFANECQLLTPLLDGAGILYVVDGSVPCGPEYQASMEILRWSGLPRMGIINSIGPDDYTAEFKQNLRQYFNTVQVFNAVYADFDQRCDFLTTLGQLDEGWQTPMQQAVESLATDRMSRRQRVANILTSTLTDMLSLQLQKKLDSQQGLNRKIAREKKKLKQVYLKTLQRMEGKMRKQVEEAFDFHNIHRLEGELEILSEEYLFSKSTWRIFGLNNRRLFTLGAVSGATIGGTIGAVTTGGLAIAHGMLVGAGTGSVLSLLTGQKMSTTTVRNMPLGGKRLLLKPTRNIKFPYIVFQRARLHYELVANRSHAQQGPLALRDNACNMLTEFTTQQLRELEKCFSRLRKNPDNYKAIDQLTEAIFKLLATDDKML